MITECRPLSILSVPFKISEENKQIIKEVAIKALKELGVTLLYSLAAAYFTATGISLVPLFLKALTGPILTIYMSIIAEKGFNPVRNPTLPPRIYHCLQYISILYTSYFDCMSRGVLVHETGHYLSADLLFVGDPKLIINDFSQGGGSVTYSIGRVTRIGEFFGKQLSETIVSAAGAGISVITSTLQLIAAHRCRKTRPELARYLRMSAIMTIGSHIEYALSSFSTTLKEKPGHDFLQLQRLMGISPIVSCIAIVAIPLIVQLGLSLMQCCKCAGKRVEY